MLFCSRGSLTNLLHLCTLFCVPVNFFRPVVGWNCCLNCFNHTLIICISGIMIKYSMKYFKFIFDFFSRIRLVFLDKIISLSVLSRFSFFIRSSSYNFSPGLNPTSELGSYVLTLSPYSKLNLIQYSGCFLPTLSASALIYIPVSDASFFPRVMS